MRGLVALFVLFVAVALVGCAGDSGPKRYRVTGNITYDGNPIVSGEVLITPDGAKKNSGAQGFAPIRDGKFDTSASGGKGYGGGPAVMKVLGKDQQGKVLCEQDFTVDLPVGADATHDIAVPKGKAGPKSEI